MVENKIPEGVLAQSSVKVVRYTLIDRRRSWRKTVIDSLGYGFECL